MTQVSVGDTVEFHYVVKLNDGTIYDSSREHGGAVEATLGGGQLVPGVDVALVGMAVGES